MQQLGIERFLDAAVVVPVRPTVRGTT